MNDVRLRCQLCSRTFPLGRKIPWCECGGLFDLTFEPKPVQIDPGNFTFWRYGGILPVHSQVSIGEPITPLISIDIGGRRIGAKLDYLLPTGSFKDRGAAVLMSAMKDAGVDRFMEDSSGNAGAAIASYAARAGVRCEIFCPSSASPAKLVQIRRAGAIIHLIDGPRDNTTAALREKVGELFYASHNWHPLFLHGTKTMAYEIAEQSGWNPPDHILAPTGGGGVLLGLALGFDELLAMNRIRKRPALHAVQSEACAPLVHENVVPKPSIAEGILTVKPPRLQMLKKVISSVITVSEAEIMEGFRFLGSLGIHAEPTSAVVIPALRKAPIPAGESVMVVLTGSGLKSQL